MRILYLNPFYYPSIGGAETYVSMISEKLAAKGHTVRVFTSNLDSASQLGQPERISDSLKKKEVINGVTIERFSDCVNLYYSRKNLVSRALYRLSRVIFKEDLDSILGEGPFFGPGFIFRIARAKADIVCAVNLYYSSCYYAYFARRLFNFRLVIIPLLHLERPWAKREGNFKIMKLVDAVIALTEFEKRFLVDQGIAEQKIMVAGAGIEEKDFANYQGNSFRKRYGLEDKPVVTFVGRKARGKGLDTLIHSMSAVWDVFPLTRFVLAGVRCRDTAELEQEVELLREKEKVIWINAFPEAERTEIFAASDIFVLPSQEESFGIVYLEAWMCNKPVIGCLNGAMEEVIDNGKDGLLVEYGNREQLSGAIISLLRDKEMRDRFGRCGREKVLKNYTWDIVAEKIEKVYRSLLPF